MYRNKWIVNASAIWREDRPEKNAEEKEGRSKFGTDRSEGEGDSKKMKGRIIKKTCIREATKIHK